MLGAGSCSWVVGKLHEHSILRYGLEELRVFQFSGLMTWMCQLGRSSQGQRPPLRKATKRPVCPIKKLSGVSLLKYTTLCHPCHRQLFGSRTGLARRLGSLLGPSPTGQVSSVTPFADIVDVRLPEVIRPAGWSGDGTGGSSLKNGTDVEVFLYVL